MHKRHGFFFFESYHAVLSSSTGWSLPFIFYNLLAAPSAQSMLCFRSLRLGGFATPRQLHYTNKNGPVRTRTERNGPARHHHHHIQFLAADMLGKGEKHGVSMLSTCCCYCCCSCASADRAAFYSILFSFFVIRPSPGSATAGERPSVHE